MRGSLLALAYLLATGVLAVAIIATLMALGVKPHTVFLPGFAMRGLLERIGLHAPNAVGVISTVLVYWLLILGVRFIATKLIHLR